MNCIVTAGPTFEPIDHVRRLTNLSTGRLGTGLADHLAARGHQVCLLLAETATGPAPTRAQSVTRFSTTADLHAQVARRSGTGVGAVFHAAAVSDFTPAGLWTQSAGGGFERLTAGKVPSDISPLWLELQATPKIIGHLRSWFPQAVLVGWKYEVDGTPAQAVARGRAQIAEYSTSACVVNGPAYGPGYALVGAAGGAQHWEGPTPLYSALAQLIESPSHHGSSNAG